MAYIITRLCVDCVDMGCAEVCPVECIYTPRPNARDADGKPLPNMLFIHPTECINCGACEPECPWEAIYEDMELPSVFQADEALNAVSEDDPSLFEVARMPRDAHGRLVHKPRPTPAEVSEHKVARGFEGG
jgi:ferredoxin